MILLKIIRDDGLTIEAGDGQENWELLAKEGTAGVEVEHFYSERGYGHGDIYDGRRVRGRTLKYTLKDNYKLPSGRQWISAFFDVLHEYRIQSYFGGKQVWIDARLTNIQPTEDYYSAGIVEATFYAADPYWNDLTDTRRQFYTQAGLWHYPYGLVDLSAGYPREAYTVYEQVEVGNTVYIYNDGDAPTTLVLALQSPAAAPVITINKALVRYTGSIRAGDTLVFDFGRSIYTLNGANIFRNLLITGDPGLKVGDNTISANVPIYGEVTFFKKYNGDV